MTVATLGPHGHIALATTANQESELLIGADGHPITIVTIVRGATWLATLGLIVLLVRYAVSFWQSRRAE